MGYKTRRRSRSKRRKGRKAKRRRTSISRKVSKSPKVLYVGPGQVFAPMLRTKLKWRDSFTYASAAATSSYFSWVANGAWKPSAAAATHQPYGWDQFISHYDFWRPLQLQYRFTVTNVATTPCDFSVRIENDGVTPPVAWRENLELPGVQYRSLAGNGSGKTQATISGKVNLWNAMGVPKQQYLADDDFRGDSATNPVQVLNLVFGTHNFLGVGNLQIDAALWFTTEFTDPQNYLPS